MKKLMFVAICVMAVMISCKNKGQTAPADSNDSLNDRQYHRGERHHTAADVPDR